MKALRKSLNALACLLAVSLAVPAMHADDAARFDLVGPKVEVKVTRAGKTLPISEVPNLEPGDNIWIKADLPPTQSNHLLIIVAFLRGTTNEPPDNWFTEIDTWDKKTAEGTTVVVPNEAAQALFFIAPETGGDFKTLRSAVKGKPGLFIRADADLNEASFEQQRIERYLAGMKTVGSADAKVIQEHSAKLAATLALKPDDKCLKLPVDQQVTCLTQSSAPVLLADGHGQSVAEALSTGASSDFINAAATTQMAGAGLYSAYVGAVVDLVHLVSLLRTAQYAYIPGLVFPDGATLNIKLNAPPSFHNPKSVIVVGLPAIQKAKLPPLKPQEANEVACLLQPKMALRVSGAPLVFSTSLAHDMVLHLNETNGHVADIPLTADAFEGGLVRAKAEERKPLHDGDANDDAAKAGAGKSGAMTVTGTVKGYWGFDTFEGPTLTLQQMEGKDWKIVGDTPLMAGKDNHLSLTGDGTACVEKIALTTEKGKDVDVSFKPAADNKDAKGKLDLDVPLKTVQPGGYALAIQQYGEANKDKVALTAYSGDIKFDAIKMHAGDKTAVLTGVGVKDVVSVQIANQAFLPVADLSEKKTPGNDDKSLHLEAKDGVSAANGSDAMVTLKDGRTMKVKVSVEAARPGLKLLSFKAEAAKKDGDLPVVLGAKDDIPLDGKLTFVVQTQEVFPRTQTVEVATADGSVHTSLSLAANTLVLQDEHTAVATLDPMKAFGQSAFGKLAMRPVAADGTAGDWTALGMLVRSPEITGVQCVAGASTCSAAGKNFFLVSAFSGTKDFAKPVEVPSGFADATFEVPMPADGTTLYLKLRDDVGAVASVVVPKAAAVATSAPAAGAGALPVVAKPAAEVPAAPSGASANGAGH